MFEEIFNDDVLNEIDSRSDGCISKFGIDPDLNCWVDVEGIESFDLDYAPTTSAQLFLELANKTIGICLIEIYEEDNKYVIYTYNKDLLHKFTFGSGDAVQTEKELLPQVIGDITHNFVNTILDKGI